MTNPDYLRTNDYNKDTQLHWGPGIRTSTVTGTPLHDSPFELTQLSVLSEYR